MFSNLTYQDKQAFFALLDEYFQSRPHLLGGGGSKNVETVAIAAAPAALALHQAAVKNPKAAASLMTTGAKTLNKWNQNQNGQSESPVEGNTNGNASSPMGGFGLGRVAAAAASFSGKGSGGGGSGATNNTQSQPSTTTPTTPSPSAFGALRQAASSFTPPKFNAPPPPPSAPPRAGSGIGIPAPNMASRPGVAANSPPPPPPPPTPRRDSSASSGLGMNGLVSKKAMGDVNTSSMGSVFASALPKKHFGSGQSESRTSIPPAFPKQTGFLPPPARKAKQDVEPEVEPEQEEEGGEWAQALYEYTSDDPGDLNLMEGQHVKVLERTSDDWWRGEVDGKQGVFPASFVQRP